MLNNRYFILLIVFAAGVAAPLNQFKVPPMMQQLVEHFDMSLAVSGWLMSLFALVGMLFALPSGHIIGRIGMKASGTIALTALLTGSVMGGMSTSLLMLISSRIIEGIGLCLISVTGPAAISAWFPPERRGAAMGVWATWVPIGTITMFIAAPALGVWQSAWIFTSVYTLAALAAFLLFFRMPDGFKMKYKTDGNISGSLYSNKSIWLLAAVFMIYNIVIVSVKTYAPIFLEQEHGLSLLKASMLTALIMLFSLASAPLCGWLSDLLKSRKIILIAGLIIVCFVMFFLFGAGSAAFPFLLILLGITGGVVPTATFSSVSEIMKEPHLTGKGMSAIALGQNAGMFCGPVLFSFLAGHYSWQTAGLMMVPLLLCALMASFAINVR
ncbi:MFS transporter [Geovibrio thiophilus]|uniref:MFS transporter n=1 Tax=Geovibrio thiophilus TaxID=139438 RepID=A0A3R5XWY0_9BACT|nr:MFS transporter [Geovibrio thiophilus]QAR32662.1 MFS transporter [Geovibrio thiophilus]